MKVKETIAFIGKADESCDNLIRRLARESYPLVLVAGNEGHFVQLAAQIVNEIPQADMEVIDCVKEGCWEADVIVLTNTINLEPELAGKIKLVATQKILVYIANAAREPVNPVETTETIQQLMPHSKIIQVTLNPLSEDIDIAGAEEAVAVIATIFTNAGYKYTLKSLSET